MIAAEKTYKEMGMMRYDWGILGMDVSSRLNTQIICFRMWVPTVQQFLERENKHLAGHTAHEEVGPSEQTFDNRFLMGRDKFRSSRRGARILAGFAATLSVPWSKLAREEREGKNPGNCGAFFGCLAQAISRRCVFAIPVITKPLRGTRNHGTICSVQIWQT